MAAEQLCVSSLKDFKKNDYKKAFLKTASWKKADGVLILVDYKMEGKKTMVAIPYKKRKEALDDYLLLKTQKLHSTRKVAVGIFTLDEASATATIEIKKGGLEAGLLQEKAEAAFAAISIAIRVTGVSDDAAEALKEPDPDAIPVSTTPQQPMKESEAKALLEKMTTQLKAISQDYVTLVKGEPMTRLKAKKSTEADLSLASSLLDKINAFTVDYAKAGDKVQDVLSEKYVDLQTKTAPNVQKVYDMLEFTVVPEGGTGDKELDALLKTVRQRLVAVKSDIIEIEAKIKQGPTATPPSGQELLDILG